MIHFHHRMVDIHLKGDEMKYSIKPLTDGSLEVLFDKNVIFYDGALVDVKSGAHLCRCGHSQNKPFCDGAHLKVGFVSQKEIESEKIQTYKGNEITIHFNRSICAGAGKCVDGLPEVFRSGSEESWIFPNEGTIEKIIQTVKSCPSGALTYEIHNQIAIDQRVTPKLEIIKNGPYVVEGFTLLACDTPTNASKSKYTLCRCGHSQNKPYCDYSHALKGWKA